MSEFLAEASVLIRPDTSKFRAELEARLAAIKIAPIAVPITAVGAGLAGAAAATAGLTAAQKVAEKSALGLASSESVVNRAIAQGIPLLEARSVATGQVAGAQSVLDASNKKSALSLAGAGNATERLNAGLLGLRTAVGSSAVIGLGALALGAIVAGKAIRASITNFAAFQQELATFRVVAGATADQMRAVSDEASRLGEDVRLPAVSASDAAVAMTELAKAGLSVEDAMAGARGVLELATAAQISNGEAALIAGNALNSFGLAGDQASRVADDLANAANAAQGSIADFGQAFAQASAVARQVGLSLEDTTSLLSLFAKNGLQGSDAGTSLRVALIKLVAPTKAAAQEIEKLGLKIRDAQGNVRADVFAQFGQATRDLTPAMRDAAAALIFGQDAIRAVAIGSREGTEGLRLMQFQIDQTGTAAEVASARTEGLSGQFSALQSNLQTLGVSFGSLISLPLTPFLTGINTALSDVNKLVGTLRRLKDIKIPPIHIPFAFDFPGGGAIPGVDIGKSIATTIGRQLEGAIPIVGPVLQFANITNDLRKIIEGADLAKDKVKSLESELRTLQQARIQAEQGGATDVADRLTVRISALKDEIKALKDAGAGIPTELTDHLKESIETLEKLKATASADEVPFINSLLRSLRESLPVMKIVEEEMSRLPDESDRLGASFRTAAGGVDALTKALAGLGRQASAAQADLLRLQSEGGSPTQIIGALQSGIDTQREIIRIRKENGNQVGDASAIAKARQQIISDQSQIKSIQEGIVSDQKAAASETERLAKEAQTARDKQFQALADTFGGRQGGIENKIERAGIAGNIQKQINLTQALVASLVKERAALLDRLKKLKVSNEVRKRIMAAITAAIENAKQDILRFEKEQQDNIKAFATPALDLRIRIAQAQDNVAAEIRARRARLALITKELVKLKNQGKKNTVAWLELKAQQQEEIAAINDLKGTEKERGKSFGELTFEFLQRQQGFAANLLGNLIPGGATAGLVGGGAGPVSTLQGPTSPAQGVQTAAAISGSRDNPLTRGDVQTELHLLRSILNELRDGNSKGDHPEAWFNRRVSGAAMDTMGV